MPLLCEQRVRAAVLAVVRSVRVAANDDLTVFVEREPREVEVRGVAFSRDVIDLHQDVVVLVRVEFVEGDLEGESGIGLGVDRGDIGVEHDPDVTPVPNRLIVQMDGKSGFARCRCAPVDDPRAHFDAVGVDGALVCDGEQIGCDGLLGVGTATHREEQAKE